MLGKATFTCISEVRHVVINVEYEFKITYTVASNVTSELSSMQVDKFTRSLLGDRYRRAYRRNN